MRVVLRDRQQWGRRHMVSTGSGVATLAALEVLDEGGTAFDAAITASAVLTVVLPMACGPGGDAVAVLHRRGGAAAEALLGLGRAPAAATPAAYRSRGLATVPLTGILSVTTPGVLDAWYALHERHGTLPLGRLLAPAVAAARDGIVVSGQLARWGTETVDVLAQPAFQALYRPYAGKAAVGTVLRQPGLARLYELVGAPGRDAAGIRALLGAEVARLSGELGGLLTAADLATPAARIGPALTTRVGGRVVATTPAPTQGTLLLQNLAVYERLAAGAGVTSADGVHTLSEIVQQTYGWRLAHLGDPDATGPADGLAPDVLAAVAAAVDPDKRSPSPYAGHYGEGDTTHLAVLDRHGNAVSWVQSLGLGFGAGVGLPELGLVLCNRLGRSATLDEAHPNCCRPGRRPVNTIFPWSVADAGGLRWLGGTPGGDGQCQWNAQTLAAMLLDGCDPLRALTQPHWTSYPGSDKTEAGLPPQLHIDDTADDAVVADLAARGHDVVRKASVGGVTRVLGRDRDSAYGLDDGRQEGLTAGR